MNIFMIQWPQQSIFFAYDKLELDYIMNSNKVQVDALKLYNCVNSLI